jgi:low affinity Fe/Cu permease
LLALFFDFLCKAIVFVVLLILVLVAQAQEVFEFSVAWQGSFNVFKEVNSLEILVEVCQRKQICIFVLASFENFSVI